MAMFQRWNVMGISTFNGVVSEDGKKVTAGPVSGFFLGEKEFSYNGLEQLKPGKRVRFSLESMAGSGTTLVLK